MVGSVLLETAPVVRTHLKIENSEERVRFRRCLPALEVEANSAPEEAAMATSALRAYSPSHALSCYVGHRKADVDSTLVACRRPLCYGTSVTEGSCKPECLDRE